jgi:hypothetical protein
MSRIVILILIYHHHKPVDPQRLILISLRHLSLDLHSVAFSLVVLQKSYMHSASPSYVLHVLPPNHLITNLQLVIKKKLHGLSPRANYTDRATAASRRSVANLCG